MSNINTPSIVWRCVIPIKPKEIPEDYLKDPTKSLFLSKIDKTNYCWNYIGSLTRQKYGRFGRKRAVAHRLSYAIHFGVDPGDLFVCHRCDNTRCVNPDHLFLGTHQQNMDDMRKKGRDNYNDSGLIRNERGLKSRFCKVDKSIIKEIKRLYLDELMTAREIGEKLSLSKPTCLKWLREQGVKLRTRNQYDQSGKLLPEYSKLFACQVASENDQ